MMYSANSKITKPRRGFTLIELLIVITILVLLLTITVSSVNFSRDAERVRGSAAQIQSFLSGARDRAIYQKKPVGVRFFLDHSGYTAYEDGSGNPVPGNRRTVSSMAYIEGGNLWSDGVIQLQRWDADGNGRTDMSASVDINGDGVAPDDPTSIWIVAGSGTAWWELKRRGLLYDGLRIRIPKGSKGTWYPIDTRLIEVRNFPTPVQELILKIPYAEPGDTDVRNAQAFDAGGPQDYELELPPRILPSEPALLADGVVIDLDGSRIPSAWRPPQISGTSGPVLHGDFSQYMDVVFSPRGNVIGTAASRGVIHFYVCDVEDATTLKDEFIASLTQPRTIPPAEPPPPPPPRHPAVSLFESGVRSGTAFVPADEINPSVTATPWAIYLTDDDPYAPSDRRLVSLFTQTGAVSVSSVYPTDISDPADLDGDSVFNEPDGLADDPYRFAETGKGRE